MTDQSKEYQMNDSESVSRKKRYKLKEKLNALEYTESEVEIRYTESRNKGKSKKLVPSDNSSGSESVPPVKRNKGKARKNTAKRKYILLYICIVSEEDNSLDGFIVDDKVTESSSSFEDSDEINEDESDANSDGYVTVQSEVSFNGIMGHAIFKRNLGFVQHYPFVNPGRADWRKYKRGHLVKQVGFDVIGGKFELSSGFIGGVLNLGRTFATRLINFNRCMDVPSHVIYTTRKNSYNGNSPQKRLPIYDVTKEDGFLLDAYHLDRLTSYPLYKGGRRDLPSGCVAAVGYTASTFKGGTGGTEDVVLLNVLFVIFLAKGITEEEQQEE
ncbi:uncharacterized protein EV420DRAFT_1486188 [Desarmillaria tabescens]|uniref:Uncharacterized protein n=1 Tax=Armillaria tabescens TaxID=1929756 RepID=A0AA39JFS2_ARMTA|nr:uncharacterized protein EV420DRAFT_1486188 [Desarmillaria tabescens]KAK0439738.1 hypothetical protein EV420DRAFT_1486188 [Desarmillaria tabescens]